MKPLTLRALLTVGTIAFLVGIILTARPTVSERRFSRAYKDLTLGMTPQEVGASFESPPVLTCTYGSALIEYYQPPPPRIRWMDTRGKIDRSRHPDGAVIGTLNETPDPYDHVVVAYGAAGHSIAHTRIGEEIHIHTKTRGPVRGSSFLVLRPSDFGIPKGGSEKSKTD